MQIRYVHSVAYTPTIELTANQDFRGFGGLVTVYFFDVDGTTGRPTYNPSVQINVSFTGKFKPETARAWGEVFIAASQIANRVMPGKGLDGWSEDIIKAWVKADELRAKYDTPLAPNARETGA